MSNKGKIFSPSDAPKGLKNEVSRATWAREQTERNAIVAVDDTTGQHFIAEELTERILRKLSPQVRVIATQMILQLDAAGRREVCQAFEDKGELVNPFRMV